MLETLLTILVGVVVLGAVGFIAIRQRRAATRIDEDGDARDVAPVLYMPQPRNTFETPRTAAQPARMEPAVATRPAPLAASQVTGARYIVPLSVAQTDVVMQLLPGRLVPVGSDVDQEIRFIRTPGVNKFTFGRSAGPANTHVQLLAATASRMHAYMVIENGKWRIGNTSETNHVLVNGQPLESSDADRWLHDGDRIELGEVSFIFRER
jgi:hypothetical protein